MQGLAELELEVKPVLVDIILLAPKVKLICYHVFITNFVQ
jgi:hypothetical protein